MGPAEAQEVHIGLDQGIGVQSNVFGTSIDETASGYYEISPRLVLSQPESDFTYNLLYQPSYRAYFNVGGINGWNQTVVGSAKSQINPRDAIRLYGEFALLQAIQSVGAFDASGQPVVATNFNGTIRRFVTDLSFDHGFSSRTMGTVTFNYDRWDYTESNNVDNQGVGARMQLTQALRERLMVGVNVDGRYRSFAETPFAPPSYSTVLNANALVRYQLTPSLRLDASGGPAGVFTRQGVPDSRLVNRWDGAAFNPSGVPGPYGRLFNGTCGTSAGFPILRFCPFSAAAPILSGNLAEQVLVALDPSQTVFGQSSESLTYFVNLGITKTYSRGQVGASFIRNEDASSGVGSTTILNSVSGQAQYEISDNWTLDLYGVYTRRKSVSQLPFTDVAAVAAVDSTSAAITDGSGNPLAQAGFIVAQVGISNFDQSIGAAEMKLTRQLSERASLQFRFNYNYQFQENQGGATSYGTVSYLGSVLFIYEFNAYKL